MLWIYATKMKHQMLTVKVSKWNTRKVLRLLLKIKKAITLVHHLNEIKCTQFI